MADPDFHSVLLDSDRSCFATSILSPLNSITDPTIIDLLRKEKKWPVCGI